MRRSAAVRHLNSVNVSKMAVHPSVTILAVVVPSPQQSFLWTFSAWNAWSWIIDTYPVVKLDKKRIFLWEWWTQSFTNICIFEKLAHAGYQDSFPLLTGTEELKAALSWRSVLTGIFWIVSLHVMKTGYIITPGKEPQYPLHRKKGGPQKQYG